MKMIESVFLKMRKRNTGNNKNSNEVAVEEEAELSRESFYGVFRCEQSHLFKNIYEIAQSTRSEQLFSVRI